MANPYIVAVEGLSSVEDIENLDERIVERARQAINATLKRTRTKADREIRQQIAFPARYLSTRLRITEYASGRRLQGTITGRDRPTSLARFVTNNSKKGVKVTVSPGQQREMGRAFILQLRGGNQGLAIRLKEGESIKNKKYLRRVAPGLYLLYGPSVNQVFGGVAEDETPAAAEFLEREFLRLMEI